MAHLVQAKYFIYRIIYTDQALLHGFSDVRLLAEAGVRTAWEKAY